MPDENQSHNEEDNTRTHIVLSKGTRVSHYTIIEKIGAGGMGDVYSAEDDKLSRKVALKFLSSNFATDDTARGRFKREAQAVAKLNHPNIVTIHEVSEFRGQPFFVMEMVDGESLKNILKNDYISQKNAVKIILQVGEALKEAHLAGVVHRDVKPANIMINKRGKVRLLDFGLAAVEGLTQLTKTGSTLGTVGYMSPEQIRGEEVKKNSDLFSLGVVLYEMLAGKSPFYRDNHAATTNAILNDRPEKLSSTDSKLSGELQHIINKLLEKNPANRYPDAEEVCNDLKQELESLSTGSISRPFFSKKSPNFRWTALVVIALATLTLLYISKFSDKDSKSALMEWKQLTFTGNAIKSGISPDGNQIFYTEPSKEKVETSLLIKDIAGGTPIEIHSEGSFGDIAWSPNGNELLFSATRSGIGLISRSGGQPRIYSAQGNVICWSPSGDQFATAFLITQKFIFTDKVSGDTTTIPFIERFTWIGGIDWSPNGKMLTFQSSGKDFAKIWIIDVKNQNFIKLLEAKKFTFGWPIWSANGDAIYFQKRNTNSLIDLMKIEVNSDTGEKKSDPAMIFGGIQSNGRFSIAKDGSKMVLTRVNSSSNIWSVKLDDNSNKPQIEQITTGTALFKELSFSPDGTEIAFVKVQAGDKQIFIMDLASANQRQLTFSAEQKHSPVWSPDGSQIAYFTYDGTESKLAIKQSDGGSSEYLATIENSPWLYEPITWSPGKDILFTFVVDSLGYRKLNVETDSISLLFENDTSNFDRWGAKYSNDGKKAAIVRTGVYTDTSTGALSMVQFEILTIEDFVLVKVIPTDLSFPAIIGWSQDDKWIYYSDLMGGGPAALYRMNIDNLKIDTVFTVNLEGMTSIAMAPNCSTFVCIVEKNLSDIWMVENFDPIEIK